MPYISLDLPPGMLRRGTRYQSRGRWFDGNLIRFFGGAVSPIGGWRRLTHSAAAVDVDLEGPARSQVAWRALQTPLPLLSAGTHEKLYALRGSNLFDITPADFTPGNIDASLASGGYGLGNYGLGAYGVGQAVDQTILEANTWQLDNFGEWLLAWAYSDETIYLWQDASATTPGVAAPLENAPIDVRAGVVVTPERFVFALGADGDDRLIRWSDQENPTIWTPAIDNQAGDQQLATPGKLLGGRRGRGETLLWTSADMWVARFIGGAFIYTFDRVGTGCGPISRQAMAVVDGRAFWMGSGSWFLYNGFVQPVLSEVHDAVFGNLNRTQVSKIVAQPRERFNEVTWYYPSAASVENDSYVTYNYVEDHWTVGQLERVGGVDESVWGFPIMADASGSLYQHEIAGGDRTTPAGVPILPSLRSGPYELDPRGRQVMEVHEILFDAEPVAAIAATIRTSFFPTQQTAAFGPFDPALPITMRVAGKYVDLELRAKSHTGTFRVGGNRFFAVPSGSWSMNTNPSIFLLASTGQ